MINFRKLAIMIFLVSVVLWFAFLCSCFLSHLFRNICTLLKDDLEGLKYLHVFLLDHEP